MIQAEAEVVPSSCSVEVEVGVEVGVGGGQVWGWAYFFGQVGGWSGWLVGNLESKANLNSSCS